MFSSLLILLSSSLVTSSGQQIAQVDVLIKPHELIPYFCSSTADRIFEFNKCIDMYLPTETKKVYGKCAEKAIGYIPMLTGSKFQKNDICSNQDKIVKLSDCMSIEFKNNPKAEEAPDSETLRSLEGCLRKFLKRK